MRQAETNAERMAVVAPISGMAVLRTVWKANNMAEVQEGEEVRAGVPVVDVVNPKTMRVRARVSQADINELRGRSAVKIGLDAYPELSFDGRIAQISPLGVVSTLSPKARIFVVLIARQRLAPQPHARPDGVARRHAVARCPARWSCRATRSAPTASARSCAFSTAPRTRNRPVTVGRDECARRRGDVRRRRRRRRVEERCAIARRDRQTDVHARQELRQ